MFLVFSYTFPRDVTADTRQYISLSLFKTYIIYVVTCYIGLSRICGLSVFIYNNLSSSSSIFCTLFFIWFHHAYFMLYKNVPNFSIGTISIWLRAWIFCITGSCWLNRYTAVGHSIITGHLDVAVSAMKKF